MGGIGLISARESETPLSVLFVAKVKVSGYH